VLGEALDSKSVIIWEREEDSQRERSQSPRLLCLVCKIGSRFSVKKNSRRTGRDRVPRLQGCLQHRRDDELADSHPIKSSLVKKKAEKTRVHSQK